MAGVRVLASALVAVGIDPEVRVRSDEVDWSPPTPPPPTPIDPNPVDPLALLPLEMRWAEEVRGVGFLAAAAESEAGGLLASGG